MDVLVKRLSENLWTNEEQGKTVGKNPWQEFVTPIQESIAISLQSVSLQNRPLKQSNCLHQNVGRMPYLQATRPLFWVEWTNKVQTRVAQIVREYFFRSGHAHKQCANIPFVLSGHGPRDTRRCNCMSAFATDPCSQPPSHKKTPVIPNERRGQGLPWSCRCRYWARSNIYLAITA